MRSFRTRLVVALLVAALLPILWAVFGTDGLASKVHRLDREVRSLEEGNRELAEGNRRLSERAAALKQRGPYLESVVRQDLGMMHEGEIVVLGPVTAARPGAAPGLEDEVTESRSDR